MPVHPFLACGAGRWSEPESRIGEPVNPDQALGLAALLHARQVDQAGQPYIGHIRRVVDAARREADPRAWVRPNRPGTALDEQSPRPIQGAIKRYRHAAGLWRREHERSMNAPFPKTGSPLPGSSSGWAWPI